MEEEKVSEEKQPENVDLASLGYQIYFEEGD